uniref:Carboxyl-terminal-processing protease n=1 Tax=Arundo donax TaxID=35708 RepID=A0A0A9GVQ5_ARUDO
MVEMFPLKSADAAYSKVSGMLSTLGDPFTKIITPKVSIYGLEHWAYMKAMS